LLGQRNLRLEVAIITQTLCKKIGGGRAAALEILIGTTAVRNLIRENK